MKNSILVVDDDPSVLYTVKHILEKANFTVFTASSGKECLEVLQKGFKGLILMDVVMPEMDGWDTVKEIVERGFINDVIICMLTGVEEPDTRMDALKEYVLDYLRKPFDTQNLVAIVKDYLSYL